jgi:hypothetical protein
MHKKGDKPRALFLFPNGKFLHGDLVCSGIYPSRLGGRPCPFSEEGRIPEPQPLDEIKAQLKPELGRAGDLVPPCAVEQLGPLWTWRRKEGIRYPSDLSSLCLFKCRQMFLLVVPGLARAKDREEKNHPE